MYVHVCMYIRTDVVRDREERGQDRRSVVQVVERFKQRNHSKRIAFRS